MRTFPVTKAFQHIVSSTFDNLRFAFQSQWPWVLVFTVVAGLMGATLGALPMTDEKLLTQVLQDDPSLVLRFLGLGFLFVAVAILGFCSIAVNWHRYVLKDEVPQGLAKFRLDHVVWRYLGNLFLVTLMIMAVMIPVGLLLSVIGLALGPLGLPLVLAAVLLLVMPLIYRLSVKLPAVALDRRDFTFSDAMRVTEGNWWQIAGLAMLVTLVSWVVGLVLYGLSQALAFVLPLNIVNYIDLFLNGVTNWVLTVIGITTLTSLYGFFVEGRDF